MHAYDKIRMSATMHLHTHTSLHYSAMLYIISNISFASLSLSLSLLLQHTLHYPKLFSVFYFVCVSFCNGNILRQHPCNLISIFFCIFLLCRVAPFLLVASLHRSFIPIILFFFSSSPLTQLLYVYTHRLFILSFYLCILFSFTFYFVLSLFTFVLIHYSIIFHYPSRNTLSFFCQWIFFVNLFAYLPFFLSFLNNFFGTFFKSHSKAGWHIQYLIIENSFNAHITTSSHGLLYLQTFL